MERRVLVVASSESPRRLMTDGPHEVLKAVLPPASCVHPEAAPVLLEGLARWFQAQLFVVLAADGAGSSSSLGLSDAFGAGESTVFYEVEVVERGHLRRARRLGGLGDFREVRQLRFRCGR